MHGGDTSVCWEWTGGTGGPPEDLRPYFTLDGKKVIAYRLVYKLKHGDEALPDNLLIRHTCDNGMCCNPKHLVPGTHADNEHDKMLAQRNGGLPRSTVERIKQMLELKDSQGRKVWTHQRIAEVYGVSRETITGINNGRRHNVDLSNHRRDK